MTEEEANSSPGGSGKTYPDGHEVVPDDVVSRRWAHLLDRSDERDSGPRGLSIPPKRLFL
jgi:hypothetical protein